MIRRIERADGDGFQVYVHGANGKKVYVGTFDSKREATNAEQDAEVQQRKIARGEMAPETNTRRTLSAAVTDWLASLEKRGSRSHEPYTDRMNIYILPELGELAIAGGLTTARVMAWRDSMAVRFAPATVNGALTCLQSACSYFVKRQWLDKNPARDVERIERPEGVFRWIQTREEITRLLSECPGDHRDIMAVLLGTGMRLDELLHLQWADVDIERRLIAVHRGRKGTVKSGKARRIPILSAILPMLRERALKRAGDLLVFPGKGGKARSKPGVRDAFKLAVKRAGLDTKLRVHDARHTFASHWILDGGDIFSLSKILGHHSVVVTEKFYAHLRPDHWDKDYGRVSFVVPSETKVYAFKRDDRGHVIDRVLVAV